MNNNDLETQGIYRFINTDVPSLGCNLRCEYCYIKQHGDENSVLKIDVQKICFRYSVEHMIKSLSIKRMGGICKFNLTGSGETLLCPQIVDIICGLLSNGHYISVVTNCTIRQPIDEIAAFSEELRARMFFKISFHYRELRRLKMLDSFVDNVHKLKKSGIAYSIEIVSGDYLLDDIEDLKTFCMKNFGALPHVLVGRDEPIKGGLYKRAASRLSDEEYNHVWSSFDSALFEYQQRITESIHREFCYAGVYSGSLMLETGDFLPCPSSKKITNLFEDIDNPIQFIPVGLACPVGFYCFLCHVFQTFAGVRRDYTVGELYSNFRDRICTDNSTWLTPTIREAFSHRCSEYHEPYSLQKQEFFNALMGYSYLGNENNNSMINFIKQYCNGKSYNRIAIYGIGKVGEWLIPLFLQAGLEVAYAIDKRACEFERKNGLAIVSPDDEFEEVDAIIVSVYNEYTAIAPLLREKTHIPIVSIVNFADGL